MGSRSNTERAKKALDAMKQLGFSKKESTPVLKGLLKLFGGNWEPIEDECYRALADAILDRRQETASPAGDGDQDQEPRGCMPDDDHRQPLTSLAVYGGPCDTDNETDQPLTRRPRFNSTNLGTHQMDTSLGTQSPLSVADDQGSPSLNLIVIWTPYKTSLLHHSAQILNIGLVDHTLNASSSRVALPLALPPPDQNVPQISGMKNRTVQPCSMPAEDCGNRKLRSPEESLGVEDSENLVDARQQPHLTLAKLKPIHDLTDISKGEERVRISVVNEFAKLVTKIAVLIALATA
ncbi:hypothetical protein GUJ93_ZPchr0458g22605 [Zizania palustris]|uniref:WIYLD domain-containing protein n=1 Tax=Zizania palustris TaxID=103762 RepID=A0A8J5UZT9_ZIZPA|nr:hypothetical protein GUJ93_ZPchr0458g22605 [Zizania palustris]